MTFNCCLQWPYYFIKSNYPVKRAASASFRRNGEEMGLPCGRHSMGMDGSFDCAANRGEREPAIIRPKAGITRSGGGEGGRGPPLLHTALAL